MFGGKLLTDQVVGKDVIKSTLRWG
jgi:hypothetical protein